MKRILIIGALACFLVAGVAVARIVVRDDASTEHDHAAAASVVEVARGPIANRESKKDKLPLSIASAPQAVASPDSVPSASSESLRQAFATGSPTGDSASAVSAPVAIPPQPASKSKPPAKQSQKNYALLSDVQIAAIKGRLNLSAAQEPLWPAVEDALRAVARKIHETKLAKPAAGTPPIDPSSAEVQQLQTAAMPLLFQLREDQKREVRSLARIIGLEQVASQI